MPDVGPGVFYDAIKKCKGAYRLGIRTNMKAPVFLNAIIQDKMPFRERGRKMNFKLIGLVAASAFAIGASVSSASADADVAAGEKIFTTKCKVCHMVGPTAKNFVGPNLNGLAGRKAGTEEGYSYSDAMKGSGLTWDEATFKEYIKDPKAKVPGIKMIFAGLPKEADEENLYAYLSQFKPDGSK